MSRALFPGVGPWFVPPESFPDGMRVTVMAPHPDDFDAIGVTMRRLHEGGSVITLAVLTRGTSGVDNEYAAARPGADKAGIREAEQLASCAFFGLPLDSVRFLRLEEDATGQLAEGGVNARTVASVLDESRPELVFLPHGNDTNAAHRRTWAMVRDALSRLQSEATMLLNRDPKTVAMREDLYVVFGAEEAEWKRALLRHHDSQQFRNLRARGTGFDERVLSGNRAVAEAEAVTRGRARGDPPGGAYAEVFEVVDAARRN